MLLKNEITFPVEYVIRIFKGSYPRLNLDKKSFKGKKICDVGCGDGRNFVVLKQCGFGLYGVEINEQIVKRIDEHLRKIGVRADVRVGTNEQIPFQSSFFDYLLSWNACYYLGENLEFKSHVKEFARVLKPEGYLVLSIPKKTCFIYQGSEMRKKGYQVIRKDPFNVRNGEILRMFKSEKEIEQEFSKYFKDFIFGSIEDDCFGLNYHWHMVICKKK